MSTPDNDFTGKRYGRWGTILCVNRRCFNECKALTASALRYQRVANTLKPESNTGDPSLNKIVVKPSATGMPAAETIIAAGIPVNGELLAAHITCADAGYTTMAPLTWISAD